MSLVIILIIFSFSHKVMSLPRISSSGGNLTGTLDKVVTNPTYAIDSSSNGRTQMRPIIDDWHQTARITAYRMSL